MLEMWYFFSIPSCKPLEYWNHTWTMYLLLDNASEQARPENIKRPSISKPFFWLQSRYRLSRSENKWLPTPFHLQPHCWASVGPRGVLQVLSSSNTRLILCSRTLVRENPPWIFLQGKTEQSSGLLKITRVRGRARPKVYSALTCPAPLVWQATAYTWSPREHCWPPPQSLALQDNKPPMEERGR